LQLRLELFDKTRSFLDEVVSPLTLKALDIFQQDLEALFINLSKESEVRKKG